jgi:hypothetical protein
MEIDVLTQLNSVRGEFAFVATYDFDPVFFDRRILTTKAFESARRIVVFMDAARYSELLNSGASSGRFDRRYFVVPVRRSSGVFHPKIILSIGPTGALAIIGSNNCTAAGTGHNLELASAFIWKREGPSASLQQDVISSAFHLLDHYTSATGPVSDVLKKECFRPASELHDWLSTDRTHDAAEMELFSSHEAPLLPQVLAKLAGQVIERITVLAPFFDDEARLLGRLRAVWPNATMQILAQPAYSNLPSEVVAKMQRDGAKIDVISAEPPFGRRLHAKAFAFESAEQTFWLVGSANASDAAWVGGNTEACLWFTAPQKPASVLHHDELKLTGIAAEDFVPGPTSEPAPPRTQQPIYLRSLILDDRRRLRVSWFAARNISDVSLDLHRINEDLPAISLPLSESMNELVLELSEGQSALFDRPIFGRLKATVGDEKVRSAPASVMQLPLLLRDSDGEGRAGNHIRRIAETGEGLIVHMDSFGSVHESIQFLNNVNIRFDDGNTLAGSNSGAWKPRDPFSGDFPNNWDLSTLRGTRDELRSAIWEFVQRHIRDKLVRHVNRGNLNGLPNFLDISRTLNALMLAYHHRKIDAEPVIPHPYVTKGMQQVLGCLIGPISLDNGAVSAGYIATIRNNLRGEEQLLREQLCRLGVGAAALATVESLIDVRSAALGCSKDDAWSRRRRAWVQNWLDEFDLESPDEEADGAARNEYKIAA